MHIGVIIGITAIAAIVPSVAHGWRSRFAKDGVFWAVSAIACIGPLSAALLRSNDVWQVDFATTIWVTIAATMGLFLVFAALIRDAWRLSPLLSAYMLLLAAAGLAWQNVPPEPVHATTEMGLLLLHIILAVTTYSLATFAAVAGLAGIVQERALKNKSRPILNGQLPSVTGCDSLVSTFLLLGEGVLGLGLLSGLVLQLAGGTGVVIDHKTVFTVLAFIVIGVLLLGQMKYGIRGRRAARYVLLAYLLLTLGYPGVKFVTDVVLQ